MTGRREASYEIIHNPDAGTAFVYRAVDAGVCGPMTACVTVASRAEAEDDALRYGLLRSGPWVSTANGYDYAPAEPISTRQQKS